MWKSRLLVSSLWILTFMFQVLCIASLGGAVASKSPGVKKHIIEELRRRGVQVRDFELVVFPLSNFVRFIVRELQIGDLRVESLTFSSRRLTLENVSFRDLSLSSCDVTFGLSTSVKMTGLSAKVQTERDRKRDLSFLCRFRELSDVERITSLFSVSLFVSDASLWIDRVHVLLSDAMFRATLKELIASSAFILEFDDRMQTRVGGKVHIEAKPLVLEARGRVLTSEPLEATGAFAVYACRDVQLYAIYSISSKDADISFLSDHLKRSVSSKMSFSGSGEITIFNNGELRVSCDIKGFAEELRFIQHELENIVFGLSAEYDEKTLRFASRLRGEHIKLVVVEGERKANGEWDVNISTNLDLGGLPLGEMMGMLSMSGKLRFPQTTFVSEVQISHFSYGGISLNKGTGSIRFSGRKLNFDLDMSYGGAQVRWKGELDTEDNNLISVASFYMSPIKDLLGMLGLDLQLDGLADGSISIDVSDGVLTSFGKISSLSNFVFGERINCLSADAFVSLDLRGTDFRFSVRGTGGESSAVCHGQASGRDSSLIFDVSGEKQTFSVSLSGQYDLSNFEMLGVPMRGWMNFEGAVLGTYAGELSGRINISSRNVELVEYPIRSSCINGGVFISETVIRFDGDSCEGFEIFSEYNLVRSRFLFSASKGETHVTIRDSEIYGSGRIEDIRPLLNYSAEVGSGTFEFRYDGSEKEGFVRAGSKEIVLGSLRLQDVDFSGDITGDVLSFQTSALYFGERVTGDGRYNMQTAKIYSSFYLRNFAGIPVRGRLSVSGDISKPYISGDVAVEGVEISEDKITEIAAGGAEVHASSAGDVEGSRGTLNVKVELSDVIYRGRFFKLKLRGVLNVVGDLADPRIFGMLSIDDGNFGLADTEFVGINGVAFVRDENVFVNLAGSSEVMTLEGEKFQIRIRVVGDVRSPSVFLSSVPQIPTSDIVCILALYRRCGLIDEFNKIMSSIVYRNFSLISRGVLESVGLGENLRILVSATDIGVYRKVGEFEVLVTQNIFNDVRKIVASRNFMENYQVIFSWDNKKYGYSMLGDIGNFGVDVKTRRKF